jgi:hypothetical protein
MRKRVVLPNRLTFPFLSSDLLFPLLLPRPQVPPVLTSCPASCTHLQARPHALTPVRASGTLQYSPTVLTMRWVLTSSPGLRYLQYSPSAQPHVLNMPWVLTKARFQVSNSRSRVLTFRQGLRYLIPGQLLIDRLKGTVFAFSPGPL